MELIDKIIEIKGDDGFIRRGIMTCPASGEHLSTALLLLPAGLKYRTGPQRFYVKLARYFANIGIIVFRFDPLGIGDSDGELPAAQNIKIFRTIEDGRFIDDVLLAGNHLKDKFGVQKVVAGGICGGAISSQLAAASQDGIIDGVLSINTSVSLAGVPSENKLSLDSAQVEKNKKSYFSKLLSPHAWKRVMQGESDYKSIFKTMFTITVGRFFKRTIPVDKVLNNENPGFINSFNKLEQSGVKHLLLFAENDNRWSEFQDIIFDRYLESKWSGNGYRVEIVEEANHELHLNEWQLDVTDKIEKWITQSFLSNEIVVSAGQVIR